MPRLSTLRNNAASIDENSSSIEVQIAQVEDQLGKCRIVSPISGTVLAKYGEAGELASVGRPLMKVADLDRIYLRAYFTSDQLSELELGQTVTVTADFGGRPAGRLSRPHHVDCFGERIYAQDHPNAFLARQPGLCREDRRRERRATENRPLRRSQIMIPGCHGC